MGGLIGYSTGGITFCYATTGAINGTLYVGGLVGAALETVSNCYATGTVGGTWDVGGLIGLGYGAYAATGCYATGAVSNSGPNTGGLIGETGNGYGATNCYAKGQ